MVIYTGGLRFRVGGLGLKAQSTTSWASIAAGKAAAEAPIAKGFISHTSSATQSTL